MSEIQKNKTNKINAHKKYDDRYYILTKKIPLIGHIDIDRIDIITDYIFRDSCVIVQRKGIEYRMLKISDIDLHTFNILRNNINRLMGFDSLKRPSDHRYSKGELDIIIECTDLTNMYLLNEDDEEIEYQDLFILSSESQTYKILSCEFPESAEYDNVCGLDILLMAMRNIYDIIYSKISKKEKEKLKNDGNSIFTA